MAFNEAALETELVKMLTFGPANWNTDYSANKIIDKDTNYVTDKDDNPVVYVA